MAPEQEMAALKKRVEVLERLVARLGVVIRQQRPTRDVRQPRMNDVRWDRRHLKA